MPVADEVTTEDLQLVRATQRGRQQMDATLAAQKEQAQAEAAAIAATEEETRQREALAQAAAGKTLPEPRPPQPAYTLSAKKFVTGVFVEYVTQPGQSGYIPPGENHIKVPLSTQILTFPLVEVGGQLRRVEEVQNEREARMVMRRHNAPGMPPRIVEAGDIELLIQRQAATEAADEAVGGVEKNVEEMKADLIRLSEELAAARRVLEAQVEELQRKCAELEEKAVAQKEELDRLIAAAAKKPRGPKKKAPPEEET